MQEDRGNTRYIAGEDDYHPNQISLFLYSQLLTLASSSSYGLPPLWML